MRATAINDDMKLAATHALAALAKEDVPDSVRLVYGVDQMEFGRQYIIPKPFDSRVLIWVASAVAKAAMESGVAQQPVDINEYKEQLQRRLGKAQEVMRFMIHKAQRAPQRVVFPEGEESKVLRAAQILEDERIAIPILVGREDKIRASMEELHLRIKDVRIVDPARCAQMPAYIEEFYRLRQRKGVTRVEAGSILNTNTTSFGAMMVHMGDADALLAGLNKHYSATIRPALQIIPPREGLNRVSGMYMLITPNGKIYFLADTTVNIEPSTEDLAEIAIEAAATVRSFDIEPSIAMLSFSSFGSTRHPLSDKVRHAVNLRKSAPPRSGDRW